MTAYNIVRMRAKPEREQELIALNRDMEPEMVARLKKNGFRRGAVVKTGERSYCFIGEWDSFDSIVKSRSDRSRISIACAICWRTLAAGSA